MSLASTDRDPNAILGEGNLNTHIVDGEVYVNSNQLADIMTHAALYLTTFFLMTRDEAARGMAQGYVEFTRQLDNLRAQKLQDFAEASYNL